MKIGYVVHHYDRAEGTGGYVVELVERIAQVHQVTLYARSVRSEVPSNVTVVRVPALGGPAYSTVITFPYALAAVRRSHDLVHAQGWVANSADVVTAHIVLDAWRRAAKQAGIVAPPGERFLGGFVVRQEKRLLRAARGVIVPSEKAREDVGRCYGRSNDVYVVRHGFPSTGALEGLSPVETGKPRKLVALYVGDARKGLRSAMEAVSQVSDVVLRVVGHSNRTFYTAMAQTFGIAGRVQWLGPTQDPRTAYTAADVLLHPTIYDTFGLVVAEAMAYGLPVIVSRNAGITEISEHGMSGWVTSDDTVAGTVDALRSLSGDTALREGLAIKAKTVAASRTWDSVAEETLAVYHKVLR